MVQSIGMNVFCFSRDFSEWCLYFMCFFMYKMQIVFFLLNFLVLFFCRPLHVRVDVFIYEIGET